MNLKWLEDFLTLCETRSFTEAASRRFLTQSALSKHMRALEIWLGAGTLLDRSTNPIGITGAGLAFKETASQIVTLLNSARRAAANGRIDTKNIYVSSTHSLSATLVPALSKLLNEKLCDQTVCLHVAANNFGEALSRYERAECDYFLCYASPSHGVALDHDEHSKLTLGTDYLVPVSIPAERGGGPYYRARARCRTPAALSGIYGRITSRQVIAQPCRVCAYCRQAGGAREERPRGDIAGWRAHRPGGRMAAVQPDKKQPGRRRPCAGEQR